MPKSSPDGPRSRLASPDATSAALQPWRPPGATRHCPSRPRPPASPAPLRRSPSLAGAAPTHRLHAALHAVADHRCSVENHHGCHRVAPRRTPPRPAPPPCPAPVRRRRSPGLARVKTNRPGGEEGPAATDAERLRRRCVRGGGEERRSYRGAAAGGALGFPRSLAGATREEGGVFFVH
jgi:hypothetical protein